MPFPGRRSPAAAGPPGTRLPGIAAWVHALRGWQEGWKLSLLKVKLSARPPSGRTAGRASDVGRLQVPGAGAGPASCGSQCQGCSFSQTPFPLHFLRVRRVVAQHLGETFPASDSPGFGPCISFMHFHLDMWPSSIPESGECGGWAGGRRGVERRKCQRSGTRQPPPLGSGPGLPASWELSEGGKISQGTRAGTCGTDRAPCPCPVDAGCHLHRVQECQLRKL